MSVQLKCDMCGKEFDHIEQQIKNAPQGQTQPTIEALHPTLRTPGRMEHLCQKCLLKVNARLQSLQQSHANEMNNDMRTWLLTQAKSGSSLILAEEP